MNTKRKEELTAADVWAMIADVTRAQAETANTIKTLREDTAEELKELGERIGGLSNNVGHHAEQFFQDSLAQTLMFGGEKYDCMVPNLEYIGKENGEFDIVLLNGKSVAIIEAKNRIHPKHVKELKEKKIVAFRKYFPKYNDCQVYLGLAGFSFSKKVIEDAKQHGIGIIKQVGKSIEIDADKLKAY